MFTIQTQEVIMDLNKIKESLERPVVIEPKKEITKTKESKQVKDTVEEKQGEIMSLSEIIKTNISPDIIIDIKPNEIQKAEIIECKWIEQLRIEYKEKLWKNPFMWWSKEVLIEKLK